MGNPSIADTVEISSEKKKVLLKVPCAMLLASQMSPGHLVLCLSDIKVKSIICHRDLYTKEHQRVK